MARASRPSPRSWAVGGTGRRRDRDGRSAPPRAARCGCTGSMASARLMSPPPWASAAAASKSTSPRPTTTWTGLRSPPGSKPIRATAPVRPDGAGRRPLDAHRIELAGAFTEPVSPARIRSGVRRWPWAGAAPVGALRFGVPPRRARLRQRPPCACLRRRRIVDTGTRLARESARRRPSRCRCLLDVVGKCAVGHAADQRVDRDAQRRPAPGSSEPRRR